MYQRVIPDNDITVRTQERLHVTFL